MHVIPAEFKIPSIIPAIKFAQFGPKDAVMSTLDIFLLELLESIVSFIGLEFDYSAFELCDKNLLVKGVESIIRYSFSSSIDYSIPSAGFPNKVFQMLLFI